MCAKLYLDVNWNEAVIDKHITFFWELPKILPIHKHCILQSIWTK